MLYSIIDDETKIQQGKGAAAATATIAGGGPTAKKAKITAPQEKILSNKRDRPAPDRDEIYRVKMPIGATAKTREILKKAADLKSKGFNGRGTSGIRKSGVQIASKTTVFARLGAAAGPETEMLTTLSTRLEQRKGGLISTRKRHASPEVTSTTTGEQQLDDDDVMCDDDDSGRLLAPKQTSLLSRLGRLSQNKAHLAPVRSIGRTVRTKSNVDSGTILVRSSSTVATTTIASSRSAHAAMDCSTSAPIRSRLGATSLSDRLSTRTTIDTKRFGVFNRLG